MTTADEVIEALHEFQVGDRVVIANDPQSGLVYGYVTRFEFTPCKRVAVIMRTQPPTGFMYGFLDGLVYRRYDTDITWWPE